MKALNPDQKIQLYRFEILLFALVNVIFNRIFFSDLASFLKYIWPINMVVLGLASVGIFRERALWLRWIKNILFAGTILVPFFVEFLFGHPILRGLSLFIYILYYSLIFIEVLRQITNPHEVKVSVIFGSFCGFLILVVMSTFSFLLLDFFSPHSFSNCDSGNIPVLYFQFIYFSIITMSSIGFGDILPLSDSARLLTGFYGLAGQFYMVAVVGIIISKFTSKI
jgi:hypothetical protein